MFRHQLIEGWDQKKLDKTRVLIAGAGAVGSHTATILARLGVSMVVVDKDFLEDHNIGNQVYTKKHLGMKKVDALGQIIHEINGVDYKGIYSPLEKINLSDIDIDFFMGALDSIGSRYYLNALSIFSGKALIDAGIEGYKGSIRTILPFLNSCMQCWPDLNKEIKARPSCSQDPIPSVVTTASQSANIQVMQMLNILFGKPIKDFITFDLETGYMDGYNISKSKECELCGN